jgi:hypothetical protein
MGQLVPLQHGLDALFAFLRGRGEELGPYLALAQRTDVLIDGSQRLHPPYRIDFMLTNQLMGNAFAHDDFFAPENPIWENHLASQHCAARHLGLDVTKVGLYKLNAVDP